MANNKQKINDIYGRKIMGRERQTTKDKDLLQQKVNLYSDMLYKIAFLQLKNNHDAEDVVQETFYQYIKTKKNFDSEEHEKAWLIKVTLNGCRKIWRCAWYRRTEGFPEKECSSESNVEQDSLLKERNKEIMDSVIKLPRKYREVIHLFYFQQMSIKEICLATERKESTVTSQLTRGRELLRKNMKEEYQYE